jgi:hypothetical protein
MLEMRVIFLVAIAIDNIIGNTKNTHFSSSGLRAKKPFFLKLRQEILTVGLYAPENTDINFS